MWGAIEDIPSDGEGFVLIFGCGINRIFLGHGHEVIKVFADNNLVLSYGGHKSKNGTAGDDVLVAQGTVMDVMAGL